MNATRTALAALAAEHPFVRKRIVAATLGEGREVLRALVRETGGWLGYEVVTPWILAMEIASGTLADLGLHVADEFEQLALLDEAMDGVIGSAPRFGAALAEGPGLRQALAEAVREMRHTGIDAGLLSRTPLRDTEKRDALTGILHGYENALQRVFAVDAADVFRIALQLLGAGTVAPAVALYVILPGPDRRGLAGRLLDAVVARGGRVLPADPVLGLDVPAASFPMDAGPPVSALSYLHSPAGVAAADPGVVTVDVFAAGSVTDELREVLRRVVARGLHWDEVEVIATEPLAYGAALDTLARRLGIPVSFAAGLPVTRTRPGRAVRAYLQWVREDLPADGIRAMFERGDLMVNDAEVSGVALARRLRALRIGRGRERWVAALEAAERAASAPPSRDDERAPDEAEAARERERAEVGALRTIMDPVLRATPDVPDRLRTRDVLVTPAALAQGLLALLDFVPIEAAVDATAASRSRARLERIAATLARPTSIDAAVSLLEAKLEDRVPAPDEAGSAPWSASGGHLHLSDIRHGGWTGRRHTFVVGLDSGRFPNVGVREAILSDDDRRRLTTGQDVPTMPTAAQRLDEARYALAALLARLRGNLTLSWPAWDAAEARSLAPAPDLLQAVRIRDADATRDYAYLLDHAPIASPVPRKGQVALDASDAWLAALADRGALRDGEDVVRAAFPGLDRGLRAAAIRAGPDYSSHHGRIAPREGLDPRGHASLVLSASRLETLGTCPLRYFMRTVLRVRPPDDIDKDEDRWLTPMHRGSLLHGVYERTLSEARKNDVGYPDAEFEAIATRALEREIEDWRSLQPPPGGAVFQQEIEGLQAEVRAFVDMIRHDEPDWLALELTFGRWGEPPVALELPGGVIRLSGAIDRVDRMPDGRLRVVDYKTGSTYSFRKGERYYGGRRLQHVLYAAVAERLLQESVARVEYHFPTVREQQDRKLFPMSELADGFEVIDSLLDLAAAGSFHPTDTPDDCKFCDYRAACRVDATGRDLSSPLAEWAKEATGVEALDTLRTLRGS